MPGFTFDLVRRTPVRSAERRSTYLSLTGTAGPYGEVTVTVGTVPRQATLAAPGLPEASVSHPNDLKQGLILIDERTLLSVGGFKATLTWNRRSFGKKGRGIRIGLGERDYAYLRIGAGEEELRDAERGPLVRQRSRLGSSTVGVTVLPGADPIDLALALVLQGADRTGLTITQTAVFGVLSFLYPGHGDV
ncbi:hypothetical protein [Microbispora sp. KK1-11]|uniref:hypothetical protein n=1 Tax=Microbispora sp. KK1-11 TaxID=2053005 RepID=UPI00115A55A0|nr:hypothetical protein [Microbispora sp. KK1-11]TQS25901.1 hypothetical protein FLW16_27365 [Microbispora sp. KK1-11]